MTLVLRPYQQEAVTAVYCHLRERNDNPCVVLPTASGKTPLLAQICKDSADTWNGRVLILAHVKELLQQSVNHLNELLEWGKVGVYSAGLKRRDTDYPIVVAGIQSVYKRACELGPFDLIIVDESHLIPVEGEGRYRTFLKEAKVVNPNVRIIGLTATPFRMKGGTICKPENLLNHVCFEVGVRELIAQGYICKLISKGSKNPIDTSRLHIRAGEFVSSEVEELMDDSEKVKSAVSEILEYTEDRYSCLIFASSVAHGEHIAHLLREKDQLAETIFGTTPSDMRAKIIQAFKNRKIKFLVNMDVLTTGFDAPNIDAIALVRPTNSPGLYYQAVGRGFRLYPEKRDCLVLDFGNNVVRHGPVDDIRIVERGDSEPGEAPAKQCPRCHAIIAMGYAFCPECRFEFPKPKLSHSAKASSEGILSGETTEYEYEVRDVFFAVHEKRGAPPDAPRTMRVDYGIGLGQHQSEWVCFEHDGFAYEKACRWWRQRSAAPIPRDSDEAVDFARSDALCETKQITVLSTTGERFDRIVSYELGPKPEWPGLGPGWEPEPECPF